MTAITESSTKFERWLKGYGVAALVDQLANRGKDTRASLGMVYAWIRGDHEPRAAKRRVILTLAAGALTHEDIDAHFLAKRHR
jgi:hypothetical protein